jgi:adenylate kinase family enzyme
LVPDQQIIHLVALCIAAVPSWILDGVPRDETQASALDAALATRATPIERLIVLEIVDEDLLALWCGSAEPAMRGVR